MTCQKVFKLVFNWYLRACADPPKLVIPRFTVPKVVLADGTVVDARCVWDCKRNGHNKTLWAPSFFIDGPQEAEDHVVKWLVTLVKSYLEAGSPPVNYTLACNYVKTK